MDAVIVFSLVRTIAYRLYQTPLQYSMYYLCNVNNTLSSGSWCCFSSTPSSRSKSQGGLIWSFKSQMMEFWMWNWELHLRTQSDTYIGETRFNSWSLRSTVHWVKQKKEMSSHISVDEISAILCLNFQTPSAQDLVNKSAAWASVFTEWTLILFLATSSWSQRRATSMCFIRTMILIELEISPDLQLSQKIWSSLAHEDLFGNFVGKEDNML